jgi:small acid-soluble spore protein E (minor gamma-type SASP)
MAKRNKTKAGTDIQQVRQQNAQSQQGIQAQNQQFGAEFGSTTDVQQVRKQNAKSQQNKQ